MENKQENISKKEQKETEALRKDVIAFLDTIIEKARGLSFQTGDVFALIRTLREKKDELQKL